VKRNVAGASFIVMLLFFSVVGLVFVGLVGANPLPAPPILEVYIRSDGSIDPDAVPIQREGSIYTFTNDLTNATITVERDNIVIDGAGYKLRGNGHIWNTGITLTNRHNIIIKNLNISDYWYSISLTGCSNIIIYHNKMLTGWNIKLDSSFGNQIVGNRIRVQEKGLGYGVKFDYDSSNNLIMGNSFYDAGLAVDINSGGNNTFYCNNYVDNYKHVQAYGNNAWDNDSVGNFWSDYNGADVDDDGIGDTPYIVDYDDNLQDRYPLMVPFDVSSVTVALPEWMSPPSLHVISPENATYTSADVFLNFTVDKETLLGYSLDGRDNVTVTGNTTLSGLASGLHNITVYAKGIFENNEVSETVYFTITEPFPVVPVAAASATSIITVSAGLLVYFKKRKH
jgi:hypothetical protein